MLYGVYHIGNRPEPHEEGVVALGRVGDFRDTTVDFVVALRELPMGGLTPFRVIQMFRDKLLNNQTLAENLAVASCRLRP